MHISDGVLPLEVAAVTGVGAAALSGWLVRQLDSDRIPKVALCTSFFFVASLVHIPFGVTSFHLMLSGLVGVVMGRSAFVPISFGLLLQAMLGHGGFTSWGANALIMGLPAYLAWIAFRAGRQRVPAFLSGFAAGWLAVVGSLALLVVTLLAAGESFNGVAWTVFVAHQPVAVLEGVVTGFAAALIVKVEPAMLREPVHA